jgi:hypothetical protein
LNSAGNVGVPALLNPATSDSYFGQLTAEVWVKLNAWNDLPDPFYNVPLSGIFCGDMFPPGSFQMVAANPNQLEFSVDTAISGGQLSSFPISDPSLFTTEVWLHVVSVYDTIAGTFAFYINGAPYAVIPLDYAPPALLTTSHLGAWLGFDGNLYRYLDGQIDEFAVYATALTPDRIAAHYAAGLNTGVLSVDVTPPGLPPVHSTADHQTNSLTLSPILRAGIGTTYNIQVSNAGDANSRMSSVPGSDLVFANLSPNAQPLTASFAVNSTTTFGAAPATTYTIATDAGSVDMTVNPAVYGPALSTALSAGGDAGVVFVGQSGDIQFSAQNLSSGASVPQADPSVYELSILGLSMNGPDAAYFTLPGPTTGQLPDNSTSWTTRIVFTPDASRTYNASLYLTTDINATPGTHGTVFAFTLTGTGGIAPAINITRQPADAKAQPGDTATFAVVANVVGTASPLTFQWKRNGISIPDATNSTYTTGSLSKADNGASFSCELAAGTVAVESATAKLTVIDTTPPYLISTIQGGALRMDWAGTGWVLQHNTDLNNPSGWTNVPAGNISPVIINPATGQDFFRLTKQ